MQKKRNIYYIVPSISNRWIFSESSTKRRDLFSYSFHIGCSQVGEGSVIKTSERFTRVQRENLFNYVLVLILSVHWLLHIKLLFYFNFRRQCNTYTQTYIYIYIEEEK